MIGSRLNATQRAVSAEVLKRKILKNSGFEVRVRVERLDMVKIALMLSQNRMEIIRDGFRRQGIGFQVYNRTKCLDSDCTNVRSSALLSTQAAGRVE
ncbi:MAG: hypothetical protein NPIRA05_11280 [Nitrospirales bacterium]|nr:MAG: hypothetical protein NPIRA05_11280 [Nitrospirales bacterium]